MDLEGSRIVVVGGAGFIGSHVVDELLRGPVAEIVIIDNFVRGARENLADASRDPRVKIVEVPMHDASAWVDDEDPFDGVPTLRGALEGADGVFLLASLWLGECAADPVRAWSQNVLGTLNVVEACLSLGVKRLVYSSSASVYGDAVSLPMTEEHPLNNRTTYGATKIACEQMLRSAHAERGLPYVGLRYMNVYGPRMDHHGTYVSLIVKTLDRLLRGDPPIIFGSGEQTYDFVYVKDVARCNVLAMKSDCADEFFNVGTGIGTSVNELAQLICEAAEATTKPEYQPNPSATIVQRRVGSTAKAKRLLGFEAAVGLPEGIRHVVDWRNGS